jgi:hypothetical protein
VERRLPHAAFLRPIRPARVVSALVAPVNHVLRDPTMWWRLANRNHLVLRKYFFFAWQARGCADLTPERFWSIYQHRMPLALDWADGTTTYSW